MTNMRALTQYADELKDADPADSGVFHELVARGVALLGLVDKDVARELGVSRPTVTRWRNGSNAPHPMMRKPVYVWLGKRTAMLLRREEGSRPSEHASSGRAGPPVALAARGREPH